MRFDDQVAVISGAGNGLGKQYALLLASRGARVLVNDIGGSVTGAGSNADAATAVAEEIHRNSVRPSPTAIA
jgi:NAD(P)-dependent dehydrogenase (short-subunit alcohol dehydrogenase family)